MSINLVAGRSTLVFPGRTCWDNSMNFFYNFKVNFWKFPYSMNQIFPRLSPIQHLQCFSFHSLLTNCQNRVESVSEMVQLCFLSVSTTLARPSKAARARVHTLVRGPKDRKVPNGNVEKKEEEGGEITFRAELWRNQQIEKDLKNHRFETGGTTDIAVKVSHNWNCKSIR